MEEETKLHWLRAREKNSGDPFSDPYADVTRLVPDILKELSLIYKDKYGEDYEDFNYLKAILSVFFARVEEDATPISKQIEEFLKAYNKLPDYIRELFQEDFFSFMLIMLALYMRRDCKADKEETRNIKLSAAYMFMKQALKEETCKAIEEELGSHLLPATKREPQEAEVSAVCVETGKHIEDIKGIVHKMFCATGRQDWDSIAAACDKYVQETDKEGEQEVAAALAYPSYDAPYFEAETNAGSTTPETSDSTGK